MLFRSASSGSCSSKVRLPSLGCRPCLLQGARVPPSPRPRREGIVGGTSSAGLAFKRRVGPSLFWFESAASLVGSPPVSLSRRASPTVATTAEDVCDVLMPPLQLGHPSLHHITPSQHHRITSHHHIIPEPLLALSPILVMLSYQFILAHIIRGTVII